MEKVIRDSGGRIKSMDLEYTSGRMEVSTRDIMRKGKGMGMV